MDTTSIDASMRPVANRFALTWTIVVAAGFVLGFLAGLPASWALSEPLVRLLGETIGGALGIFAFTAIFGLAVGGAEAIVLRRRANPLGWLLGSVLGSVVPVLLLLALLGGRPFSEATDAMGLAVGGLIGLGMGIGQWLAARGLSQRMAWWSLFSAAGLLVGWGVSFGLAGDDLAAPAVILGGVLAAGITGLGMRWLLRK